MIYVKVDDSCVEFDGMTNDEIEKMLVERGVEYTFITEEKFKDFNASRASAIKS